VGWANLDHLGWVPTERVVLMRAQRSLRPLNHSETSRREQHVDVVGVQRSAVGFWKRLSTGHEFRHEDGLGLALTMGNSTGLRR
jgi:hypothetical protein